MRTFVKWSIIIVVVLVVVTAIAVPAGHYWKERNRTRYREAEVSRGKIVAIVNATGTIKPVRSVQVGSFVSGPIISIDLDKVDFTKEVKKDDILVEIDPAIYQANFDRDSANVEREEALLIMRTAEIDQAKARWDLRSETDFRARKVADEKEGGSKDFISASDLDQFKFNKTALEATYRVAQANLKQAQANLKQAKASLKNSEANLGYTKIRAPENGVIIDRKVDRGQTVAATFQTPDLFVIAPNLREKIHVYASVDETDIGLISAAQKKKLPVRFTVDAHPDDLFDGEIFQIRQNSSTTQNVVTYPVVVSAPNTELKLFPGMTANVSFQIGERTDKLRIPNAALRFFPQREQVRKEDRKILEGAMHVVDPDEQAGGSRSAEEKAELRRLRSRRHVWVIDGDSLRAVEVIVGLSDSKYTEIISSEELIEGTKMVTGVQPRN